MELTFNLLPVLLLLVSAVALSRLVPTHPRWRPLVIALNLSITIRYLVWRGTETLNDEGVWGLAVSLSVFLAELYGFLVVLHHYLIATRSTDRRAVPPGSDFCPTVDVFVTTYNEGTDILYRTLVGCLALEYRRATVHVLDDGRRPEVAELCRRLGVLYLTRDGNAGAKAGNLNSGLAHGAGDLVVTFDADHVPVRTFLTETVGFFRDPGVVQVQTAHHFYNPDLFQDRLRIREYIANEQDMFYHVVQPGRDVYNSSFYCGSGAVFRRSALDAIGGFPTSTVTEDLHTSMLLHSRGFKSVYVNRDLSAGLAPESYDGYVSQRQRWARGTFQVMVNQRGLLLPGLTLMQRINYLATFWYWLYGFPRVVYLVAPVFFLLGGIRPLVVHNLTDLLSYYVPHLAISIVAFQLVNRGMRRIFWSDVYESCISVQAGLTALFFPFSARKVRFAVTPKGRQAAETPGSWRMAWPMIVLTVLLLAGLLAGVRGLPGGGDRPSILINVLWTVYNLVVLGMGLLLLRPRPQRRTSPRLRRRLSCQVAYDGTRIEAETLDVSETGLAFVSSPAQPLPDCLGLTLYSADRPPLNLRGRLVRCELDARGQLHTAVEFIERGEEQHRRLIELMFSVPDAWNEPHGLTMTASEHLKRIVASVIAVLTKERCFRRRAPRFARDLPATLLLKDGRVLPARTVNLSLGGAAIRLPRGQDVGGFERLSLTIFWNRVERSTLAVRVQNTRSAAGGERILGLAFALPTMMQRRVLIHQLYDEPPATTRSAAS